MSISQPSGEPPSARTVTARGSGLWLMFIVWLAVFAGAYAWFHQWDAAQDNPNPAASMPAAGEEVTLQRNRSGHYVAEGTINVGCWRKCALCALEERLGRLVGVHRRPVVDAVEVGEGRVDGLAPSTSSRALARADGHRSARLRGPGACEVKQSQVARRAEADDAWLARRDVDGACGLEDLGDAGIEGVATRGGVENAAAARPRWRNLMVEA